MKLHEKYAEIKKALSNSTPVVLEDYPSEDEAVAGIRYGDWGVEVLITGGWQQVDDWDHIKATKPATA